MSLFHFIHVVAPQRNTAMLGITGISLLEFTVVDGDEF